MQRITNEKATVENFVFNFKNFCEGIGGKFFRSERASLFGDSKTVVIGCVLDDSVNGHLNVLVRGDESQITIKAEKREFTFSGKLDTVSVRNAGAEHTDYHDIIRIDRRTVSLRDLKIKDIYIDILADKGGKIHELAIFFGEQ